VDINGAWESSGENMKGSVTETRLLWGETA